MVPPQISLEKLASAFASASYFELLGAPDQEASILWGSNSFKMVADRADASLSAVLVKRQARKRATDLRKVLGGRRANSALLSDVRQAFLWMSIQFRRKH
jgi:hypothetical protein